MEDNSTFSIITFIPTNSPPHQDDAFENLFPALLECFAIIFAGYFADVDWLFLLSIFIGKVTVFIAVVLLAIILLRPIHFGKVGIYGIFVTQSHDFALGIPIVRALYSTTHPDYEKYLYLIAPISVAFLNPIGFLLMEVHRWKRSSSSHRQTKCRALAQVLAGVATNPIVFMTALGIVGNFIFKQKVPSCLDNILVVLGQSFAATALFCLGHCMVFRGGSSIKGNMVTLSLLIAAKMLISPLLIRELVNVTHPHTNCTALVDLATYGFLYGTFPTAPTVYIYATLYSVQAQLMATGMVVSTFLSAPIIYISARVMTLPVTSEATYKSLIFNTARDISIVGVVSCVWVLIVFLIHKRVKMVPHQFTSCLVISQMVACVGIIIRSLTDSTIVWQHFLQFIPYFVGVMGTRCWMSCVAVCLCLLKARSLCYVLKNRAYFYLYGFGVPVLLCSLVIVAAKQDPLNKDDPCYMFGAYGKTQGIVSVIVLVFNIVISIVALIVSKRSERCRQRFDSECTIPDCPKMTEPRSERMSNPVASGRRTYGTDSVAASAPPVMGWMQQQVSTSSASNQGSPDVTRKAKGKKVKVKPAAKCSDCHSGCASQKVRNIEDIVADVPRRNNTRTRNVSETTNTSDSGDEDERKSLLNSGQQPCVQQDSCNAEERRRCESLLQSYSFLQNLSEDDPMEESAIQYDFQETRHQILLLILLASSTEGVFLLIWRLMGETENGVFVELEFLDTFLLFGQGFFAFLLFGLDQKMVIEPFMRRVSKLLYRRQKPVMKRSYSELDPDTVHTCEQFTSYHIERCKQEIVMDKTFSVHSQLYKDVFTGTELIDWLIEVGLSNERSEGIQYGRRLLDGVVIEHITGNHHFLDMPYLYRLCGHVSTNNATPIEERNGDLHQNSAAAADIEEHDDVQNSNTNSTDILIHT